MATENPEVKCFFHDGSNTCTYLVSEPSSKKCALIDCVLDFNASSGKLETESVDHILEFIDQNNYQLLFVLETHAHADHVAGGDYVRNKTNAKLGIGHNITRVQEVFSETFNFKDFQCDGSQFDVLFKEGDTFNIGDIECSIIETPGHTPACISYVIGDCVFTGDSIFMPDFGTARCDFPDGSAEILYESIQKLYTLPDHYRLFVGHDYGPNGRDIAWETTIGEEKQSNKHVAIENSKDNFIEMRNKRDETLNVPRLLFVSVQSNINAGRPPLPEDNGTSYFKIPTNHVILFGHD
eukprot:TRINITY_DN3145_c0_g1_i1.p1 TRINITY_DN3145_c0_g1~~TRINITY_DN3145_c0_g1_i1.p1  ORF type:complete len:295 (-),score=70.27 TRINITY_DN3145_c0_g1_i1:32-916(-)